MRVYLSSLFLFLFRCPEKVPGERIAASNAVTGPQGQQLESAIALLKRHATKVDPIQSLMLLPSQTPIFKLKHFLETVAKHTQRERKSGQIFRNLLLSQHLQIQGQRIRIQQSHKIIIEDNDLCRSCHKRIGKTSVSLLSALTAFRLTSSLFSLLFSEPFFDTPTRTWCTIPAKNDTMSDFCSTSLHRERRYVTFYHVNKLMRVDQSFLLKSKILSLTLTIVSPMRSFQGK